MAGCFEAVRSKELQVKNKKLLISLAVVAVVVVVVVVLAAVFTVQDVNVVYYDVFGNETFAPQDALNKKEILAPYKGKSIVFLSKDDLLSKFNRQHPEWHAFGVTKNFPNLLEIHIVKRTTVLQFHNSSGETIYVDTFGYATSAAEYTVIDVTSAFSNRDVVQSELGAPVKFSAEESNTRLSFVLETILATWQCYNEFDEISEVLGEENVFEFYSDGSMRIHMREGGYILVQSPGSINLAERLIAAFSIYNTTEENLKNDDCVITIHSNGKITTPFDEE